MKKLILILAFGLMVLSSALSQTKALIKVVSKEDQTLDGNTEIEISYYFSDSTSLSGNIQTIPKTGWSVINAENLPARNYYYSDTLTIKVQISYPLANLPFFPVTLHIKHQVTYPDSGFLETQAKVYFTPYNSIEIWDYDDFINL